MQQWKVTLNHCRCISMYMCMPCLEGHSHNAFVYLCMSVNAVSVIKFMYAAQPYMYRVCMHLKYKTVSLKTINYKDITMAL